MQDRQETNARTRSPRRQHLAPGVLTAEQAALRLGLSKRRVYELMQQRRLGSVHPDGGRPVVTTEADVAAYARRKAVLPQGPAAAGGQSGPGTGGVEQLPAHLHEGWWRIHRQGLQLPPDVQAYLLQHFQRHLEEATPSPGTVYPPAPRSA